MSTLMQAVKRLRDRWILPPTGAISVKDLNERFQPIQPDSLRSLLLKMGENLPDHSIESSTHPYYRRSIPRPHKVTDFSSDTTYIDLSNADVHLAIYGELNPVAKAVSQFDGRAAAAVWAATIRPEQDLLETKNLIKNPTAKCLAVMAYSDYFPEPNKDFLWGTVSEAILQSSPGFCGTFGPSISSTIDTIFVKSEGNYDFAQMYLLSIAYRYYDKLSTEARKHLINELLAKGVIHRPNLDDINTSGRVPNDWSRAGFLELPHSWLVSFLPGIKIKRIGETENHILTIHTARYLTNQLLYQRDHDPAHDNRRNGSEDAPTCTELMLMLLRNILRDDFSEYNAKNYQNEVRDALLNLCSYAYDHEVRLAARMVLDYISAYFAVSSSDLRRMVPFRRRNEGKNVTQGDNGSMAVSLLEMTWGADPMAQRFAILAGNTRIYSTTMGTGAKDGDNHDRQSWHIKTDESDGNQAVMDAVSDYRLPPAIHDLFVNDVHRRFFQRLHRVPQDDMDVTGRNCDNYEIYAGSPSYLITAGGSPSSYAINPTILGIVPPDQDQQLGVALTTSFMPTLRYDCGDPAAAKDLIQFSRFTTQLGDMHYGVAPDFACGYRIHLPKWVTDSMEPKFSDVPGFYFVNRKSAGNSAGFFLAIYKDGDYALLEAFDTWLHPNMHIEQFKTEVLETNRGLSLSPRDSNGQQIVDGVYNTRSGTRLSFFISPDRNGTQGAEMATTSILEYGDWRDAQGNAGNVGNQFLNGTILNSAGDGKIEISNTFLHQKITLDMIDPWNPKRTSETGEIEEAGSNHEVWVDFGWAGPTEGDFFHPFSTITAASAGVADGGVIKIMPGWTTERPFFQRNKKFTLTAPMGNVTFGVL